MSNTAPITLDALFRYYRDLPHQRAAVKQLEEELTSEPYVWVMRRDRPWFHTWSQSGKQPESSSIPLALALIKKWEGCELEAYPDPGTGGEPWTIGFGSTYMDGRPVKEGDRITQAKADSLLEEEVLTVTARLGELLPMMISRPAHERAALTSWAYNIGLGALSESTLRKRLFAGEDPREVARTEIPRWNKAGGKVMQGLVNRRADEVRLFLEG
jgi:lysozyme